MSNVNFVSASETHSPSLNEETKGFDVRPVTEEQWPIVAWLWQAYRHDLATIVHAFPYADGRYQTQVLDRFPLEDGTAYLAWRPHPKTGEDAPIGFALVQGLTSGHRSLEGFWVTPMARRGGVGTSFAQQVLALHDGPWVIAFQHENMGATFFWRRVADLVFGPGRWSEDQRPVPGLPDVPRDHFITTTSW